ncbi:Ig-like domain-containing protein [Rhodococcus tukisamuensis]|uniref:Ig-like domain (Group 3) n=1 Tax=Rhodococcus tukisamuensis TaxID=168276 RepID=A0A1G7CB50_9NOCA|nr:Ig-like domain-containing protein [Rhodococcus tukisamuensis]SDE36443.1 Ig-like domain (group 3) [Rhodococcus tukisamuensis]
MSGKNVRRGMATVGAFAVAAGFVVTGGTGLAGAAPETINLSDGGFGFARTVSNTTPLEGETVTVTTTVTGTGIVDWLEDYRPTCMTYKTDSVRVAGLPVPVASIGPGLTRVAGSWDAATSPTFSFQYLVGANCPREAVQTTGIKYGSGTATGSLDKAGPSINVPKNVTTTVLSPVAPGRAGIATKMNVQVLGGREGDLVKFYSATTEIGSVALDAAGKASYNWTPAATQAGEHQITATFPATPFAAESSSAAQTVTIEPGNQSTVTTVSVPAAAQTGSEVIFDAQVSPFPGAGTVTFKVGTTELATVPVGADGKASLIQTFTVPGDKSVTAVFSGAPGYLASTSAPQVMRMTEPGATDVATTLTLAVPAIAQKGRVVFLSADVSPKPVGGTVRFFSGVEPLGNAIGLADGRATQTYTFLEEGNREIHAVYTGAPGYLGSDVTGTVSVTADPVPGGGGGSLGGLFGSS